MELDDLKNIWQDAEPAPQRPMPAGIIDKVVKEKYHSTVNRIIYPEIAGCIVCLAGIVYVSINFYRLDTAFLQATGLVSILLLLLLTIFSFLSWRQLRTVNVNQAYAITLQQFARRQLLFFKFQRANLLLSYLLLVSVIILFAKFFAGNDITGSKYFWTLSFSIGYIFLLFFSRYVTKMYGHTLKQATTLLQDLQVET